MLKRGYVGIYHRSSQTRVDRYAKEYAELRNLRQLDTITSMSQLAVRFSKVQLPGRTPF